MSRPRAAPTATRVWHRVLTLLRSGRQRHGIQYVVGPHRRLSALDKEERPVTFASLRGEQRLHAKDGGAGTVQQHHDIREPGIELLAFDTAEREPTLVFNFKV